MCLPLPAASGPSRTCDGLWIVVVIIEFKEWMQVNLRSVEKVFKKCFNINYMYTEKNKKYHMIYLSLFIEWVKFSSNEIKFNKTWFKFTVFSVTLS